MHCPSAEADPAIPVLLWFSKTKGPFTSMALFFFFAHFLVCFVPYGVVVSLNDATTFCCEAERMSTRCGSNVEQGAFSCQLDFHFPLLPLLYNPFLTFRFPISCFYFAIYH